MRKEKSLTQGVKKLGCDLSHLLPDPVFMAHGSHFGPKGGLSSSLIGLLSHSLLQNQKVFSLFLHKGTWWYWLTNKTRRKEHLAGAETIRFGTVRTLCESSLRGSL